MRVLYFVLTALPLVVAQEATIRPVQQTAVPEENIRTVKLTEKTELPAPPTPSKTEPVPPATQPKPEASPATQAKTEPSQSTLKPKTEAPTPTVPVETEPPHFACIVPTRNVALGRPTFQTSTSRWHDGGSEKAVDGNKNTDLLSGHSCTYTYKEYQPRWTVWLGETYDIYEVLITNRGDCCDYRLTNAEVRVGESFDYQNNRACGSRIPYDMTKYSTIRVQCGCAIPMRGQFVSVQLVERVQILHLCEVEVMTI